MSDAEVKDDEELNKDEVRRLRGEAPAPRKPWGARRGLHGKSGLPKRVYTFDASLPIGLRIGLRSLQVIQVTNGSQGSSVRVGWRLIQIDAEPVRAAKDLKDVLGQLTKATRSLAGHQQGEATSANTSTTWIFEVPARASAAVAGPPLAVLSGQRVRLDEACGPRCEFTSCKHRERIAFRLDKDKDYTDLHGRPVESEPKFFPEGQERVKLDQEGSFPQTGQRIPLFGEAWEEAHGTCVAIETVQSVKFPVNALCSAAESETHGALPDPKAPLLDVASAYKMAKAAVREQFRGETMRMRQEIRGREAAFAQMEAELATLQAQENLHRTTEEEVERSKKRMLKYKHRASFLQRQLRERTQRAKTPAATISSHVTRSADYGERSAAHSIPPVALSGASDGSSLPGYASSASVLSEAPSPAPVEENADAATEVVQVTSSGWWDRLHSRHANRIAKRDRMHHEGLLLKEQAQSAALGIPPPPPPPLESWKERDRLLQRISSADHLTREAHFLERRQKASGAQEQELPLEVFGAPRGAVCAECGYSFRINKRMPSRTLAPGARIEASYFGKGHFFPATITSVRSTGNCDVVYDSIALGSGKNVIEKNVSRKNIREVGNIQCMCHTRRRLGYRVAQVDDSHSVPLKISTERNVSAPQTGLNHGIRASIAYRGTGTILDPDKRWQAIEERESKERKQNRQVSNGIDRSRASDAITFAARQEAWYQDRTQRALDKQMRMHEEASKPWKTARTTALVQLQAQEAQRRRSGATISAATLTQSVDAAGAHGPSVAAAAEAREVSGDANGGDGTIVADNHWEQKEIARVEKQLLACGFERNPVKKAVQQLWRKMKAEVLWTGSRAPGGLPRRSRGRCMAVEDLIFEAIKILRQRQLGPNIVGAPVDILSSKQSAATAYDESEGSRHNDEVEVANAMRPRVVGSGTVKSFDAAKGRVVVLLDTGKLVSVKPQLIRQKGSARDPDSFVRARSTGTDATKRWASSNRVVNPEALQILSAKLTASRAIPTKSMYVTTASKGRLLELAKERQAESSAANDEKRRSAKMAQRRERLGENKRKSAEEKNEMLYREMIWATSMLGGEQVALDLDGLVGTETDEAQIKQAARKVWGRMKEYMQSERARVLDLFRSFDRNNSGALDSAEFGAALKKMGIKGELVYVKWP